MSGTASIDHLELLWRSIDDLCASLTDAEWATPTGCPGWSVKDNVSHLIDYEVNALGRPRPDHVVADLSHTKNPMGEMNEVGVDHRRARTGPEVLAELREVTAERLAQLRSLTEEELAAEMMTPAGPGTVASMLTLRVMDTWSHEQDIRRAIGRPGNLSGPAAQEAVDYLAGPLPLIVGKRAGAPDGATVVIEVGDLHRSTITVAGGRASRTDASPAAPTVALRIPVATFPALTGGRSDIPDDVEITGDQALGRAIVASMGFLP